MNNTDQYGKEVLDEWKLQHEHEVIHLDSGTTIDSHEIVFLIEQHLSPSEFIVYSAEDDAHEHSDFDVERMKLRDEILDKMAAEIDTDLSEIWDLLSSGRLFVTTRANDVHLTPDDWTMNHTSEDF